MTFKYKGGAGSGNFGHAGRPGKVGGSVPIGTAMSLRTGRDAAQRQAEAKQKGKTSMSIGGSGNPSPPNNADVAELQKKLSSVRKGKVVGGQIDRDPDVQRILRDGKSYEPKATYNIMTDGRCHWNVSELYKSGDVDAIVIGYTNNGKGWYQHTWGLKNGKVVETTMSNVGNKQYYGLELTGREADAFADWTSKNPPGGGVVRRVP